MELSSAQKVTDSEHTSAERQAFAAPQSVRIPRAPRNGLALSLERRRLQLYIALLIFDAVILLGSFAAVSTLYMPLTPVAKAIEGGILLLPLYHTIALYSGTYSRDGLIQWRSAAWRSIMALLVSTLLLVFLTFLTKTSAEHSRFIFGASVVSAALMMTLVRMAVAHMNVHLWGPSVTNRLLIEAGGPEVHISHLYRISAREHALTPDLHDPVMLDRLARYLRNMDQVIVSCQPQDRLAWAEVLKCSGLHGEVISDFAREIGALGIIQHREANVCGLLVSTGQLAMRSRVMKRIFDVAVSVAGLLFLTPVMLLCALAIKLDDGGPVFFRQRRMGRGNTFFDIYKFRSMREAKADANGDRSASRDDDRITRVGRFLRRTSLDELPQLINVLTAIGSRLPAAQSWTVVSCRCAGCAIAATTPTRRACCMIAKVCLWMTLAALALLVVIVQTDRQAYRDPAAILLVPGPARVVAGQRLAELTVANGGRGSDLSGTRLLVRWRPIPAHNLLLHAQMAQINGQGDQVVPPLEAAASRGWREPQLQLLVGRSALIERNYVAAAQRLAALLAIGSEGPATSQLAADLLAIPAGRRALISILATPGRYTRPVLRYFAWHKSPALAEDLRAAAGPDGQLPCATVSALAANYRQRGREQLAAGLPATRCPVS